MLLTRRQLVAAIGLSLSSASGFWAAELHATPVGPVPGPKPDVKFDLKQLSSAGFSADVAAFFSHEPRFLPGIQNVKVSVNAGRMQERQVRFDAEGKPCFDTSLLAQLGLSVPPGVEADGCARMNDAYPGMRIELRPGQTQMHVTVPQSAFDKSGVEDGYQRGGKAALLNYDLFTQRYQSRNGSSGYLSANLEAGINVNNWAVRTRGSYSQGNTRSRYTQQETFAQRPVEKLSALLQVGQLSALSDGFGGVPIMGAQLFSDSAQQSNERLAVPIQGIADSNAIVEVRQRGQLVYRTVVAPGAFSISDVGAVTRGTDIEVLVIEEDGHQRRFVVPAPMTGAQQPMPPSFHIGAGRYRRYAGSVLRGGAPWVAYGDYAFDVSKVMRLSNAAMVSNRHQAIGSQATLTTGERAWWGAGARISRAKHVGLGFEWQVQGNANLGAGFNAGVSWQSRTRDFRLLDDVLQLEQLDDDFDFQQPFQRSLSASLNWANAKWGSFGYSVSRNQSPGSTDISHTLTANRRFGKVSANLSLQKTQIRGLSTFLNLQIPLGGNSVSARAYRYGDGQQTVGLTYQGRANKDVSYQLEGARSESSQRLGASMQARTAYGSINAGISQADSNMRSFYGTASGGMAWTSDNMFALSSSKISDTFAVVKIPKVAGIGMSASGGNAKTSALGTALVPSIYPYRDARIQLDGKTLPFNYRFDTTAVDLKLARGTVATHTIGAQELRQLMLNVRTDDDKAATVGSSIFNADGDFMGTVVGEGNIILDNEQIGTPVYMDYRGKRCEIRYDVPARFDPKRPYEEASAICA